MTLELFFVGGSFVVGVAQMAEAWILMRDQGRLSKAVAATSTVAFAWAVFCVYLLVTGRLEFARWLAVMFLAFIPVEIVVGIVIGIQLARDLPPYTPDTPPVPRSLAWLSGVFGAAFAAAALILLAT